MIYQMYLATLQEARSAIDAGDDGRLRALCANVATRNGADGAASLLAMSDAEQGRSPRRRREVLWLFLRRYGSSAPPGTKGGAE